MANEKHEYTPLHEDDEVSQRVAEGVRTTKLWRLRFLVLVGFFLSSLGVIAFLLREINVKSSCYAPAAKDLVVPYSPVSHLVEYENRWLARDPETHRFMGKPRPELDQAWHELLDGTLIQMSKEELLMADNATSVPHKDGGYVTGLGISHSLHCLKRLKQYLHPDYYYTSPDQDWDELEKHADHCLEALRQLVMCQPDLSIYTLQWTPHSRVKPTSRVPQAHVCVNYDRIHEWMKSRSATNFDMVRPPPELWDEYEKAAISGGE